MSCQNACTRVKVVTAPLPRWIKVDQILTLEAAGPGPHSLWHEQCSAHPRRVSLLSTRGKQQGTGSTAGHGSMKEHSQLLPEHNVGLLHCCHSRPTCPLPLQAPSCNVYTWCEVMACPAAAPTAEQHCFHPVNWGRHRDPCTGAHARMRSPAPPINHTSRAAQLAATCARQQVTTSRKGTSRNLFRHHLPTRAGRWPTDTTGPTSTGTCSCSHWQCNTVEPPPASVQTQGASGPLFVGLHPHTSSG